ncbi:MAG: flavodoxin [Xanthomonadaceae bacterium]|nr:flavodoxin [Xanthomonadaceae bacterium]
MFKQVIFQLHWLFGISAGLVLAIMGISGATLSFEDEILERIDPAVLTVPARDAPRLAPPELIRRIEAAEGQRVIYLATHDDPTRSLRVRFQPLPGQRRGASVYFDPYTGQPLGEQQGKAFFEFVERLHRQLVAGDRGKALTGASVLALLFFAISGLYLRWPKRALDWRSWLTLDPSLRGRSLFWALHSIVGTWCLPFYLLLALTGLYWSYDWYRDGLSQLLDGRPAVIANGGGAGRRSDTPPTVDHQVVWQTLREAADGPLGSFVLRPPERAGQAYTVSYLNGRAEDRVLSGANQLRLDPQTGAVLEHRRYAERSFGSQLYASVYALHVGSYFGLPGRLLVMIASLCMPLFFVTGWLLYLDRQRKKQQVRAARGSLVPGADGGGWLVGFASQSGFAEQLAWQSAGQLQAAGWPVQVKSLAQISEDSLRGTRNALFVVSTFGDGEAPDSARGFERKLLGRQLTLPGLQYGLLALGDRQYASFCGFADRFHAWLERQGAVTLFAPVQVDKADEGALQGWRQQLARLTGVQASAPKPPAVEAWPLEHRRWLNPGSEGAPTWRVSLRPPAGAQWQAGDVLEVLPRHAEALLRARLDALGLDPQTPVRDGALASTLLDALATRQWPDDEALERSGGPAQALVDGLPQLPPREYSIASLPQDGVLDLVVRLARCDDGTPGLGSGWLCLHAAVGTGIDARLRRNSSFHAPDDDRPLILIGNGTGLAGLRSLLKLRERRGHRGNWLLFGERKAEHDYYFRDEIEAWQASGHLQRLDLAFSRDQLQRVYVQQRLHEAAAELTGWNARGAAIYVCGSLDGMASGVDRVLRETLGDAAVDRLVEDGRYRRDVY